MKLETIVMLGLTQAAIVMLIGFGIYITIEIETLTEEHETLKTKYGYAMDMLKDMASNMPKDSLVNPDQEQTPTVTSNFLT